MVSASENPNFRLRVMRSSVTRIAILTHRSVQAQHFSLQVPGPSKTCLRRTYSLWVSSTTCPGHQGLLGTVGISVSPGLQQKEAGCWRYM
ncbi:unnamed protein product [Protopolystoma xenopodis]|uniref:Uncharacterized protein n=1 Tax=Protopolystoma xenopodis TaxID=117903 RepID=A0A448WJ72_9PLAT|nr:unnamed protein product [Protopolystoma xenopodis]